MPFDFGRFIGWLSLSAYYFAPYLYMRLYIKRNVDDYRDNVLLVKLQGQFANGEQLIIVSKNGRFINTFSIPVFFLMYVPTMYFGVFHYFTIALLFSYSLILLHWINNYFCRIVVTNFSVYACNFISGKHKQVVHHQVRNVSVYKNRSWSEIMLNGVRILPNCEIDNANDIKNVIESHVMLLGKSGEV